MRLLGLPQTGPAKLLEWAAVLSRKIVVHPNQTPPHAPSFAGLRAFLCGCSTAAEAADLHPSPVRQPAGDPGSESGAPETEILSTPGVAPASPMVCWGAKSAGTLSRNKAQREQSQKVKSPTLTVRSEWGTPVGPGKEVSRGCAR